MNIGTAEVIHADARNLPLDDNSVDLVVTSPPYFALRSYQDGGEHYDGQIGAEPTPDEFVSSLLEVTRECMRVLKPSGSLWVNLGDKYSQRVQVRRSSHQPGIFPDKFEEFGESWAERAKAGATRMPHQNITNPATGAYVPEKSLMGLPWRYALRCIDDLGLILRAEIIWSKPNGLPESVTDRVRRSHEQWFHFTLQPRYFSAVDEIREPHTEHMLRYNGRSGGMGRDPSQSPRLATAEAHPLGKLPGSVWTIPTEPLRVPESLGVDHFAAFPTEFPKRIIQGWSPAGVCIECGEGRRPVVVAGDYRQAGHGGTYAATPYTDERQPSGIRNGCGASSLRTAAERTITGYTCACPEPTADTRPAIVLDPFGGTGTTALVAKALGRHGITIDKSADYCRLAQWRTGDRDQLAKVLGVPKADPIADDEQSLLDLLGGESA